MIEAINAGRVPPAFQEDLQSRANELVNTVNCPQTTDQDEDDEKKDEKEKKDKQNDDEQSEEEPVPTEPVPTVPEDEE